MKHIIKPTFKQLFCIFCASFFLTGCSYFDRGESVDVEAPAEKIDVTNSAVNAKADVPAIISDRTHGSVQVFSLDDPAIAQEGGDAVDVAPLEAVAKSGSVMPEHQQGFKVPSDPSVQVFPLQ